MILYTHIGFLQNILIVRAVLKVLVYHLPQVFTKTGAIELEKELVKKYGKKCDPKIVAKSFQKVDLRKVNNDFENHWKDRNVFQYLDDIMNGATTKKMANLQLELILFWGRYVGWEFEPKKVEYAHHIRTILGYVYNAKTKRVSLKPKFITGLREIYNNYIKDVTNLKLARTLLGKLIFGCRICPRLFSFLTSLNDTISSLKDCAKIEPGLKKQLLDDLSWISSFLNCNGDKGPSVPVELFTDSFKPLSTPSFTDASGWETDTTNPNEGHCGGFFAPRYFKSTKCLAWSLSYSEMRNDLLFWSNNKAILPLKPSIAYLELLSAVIHIVWLFTLWPDLFRNRSHILKVDNTNVISWFTKGRMKFRPYNYLMMLLSIFELKLPCRIKTVYISSKANRIADSLTRENAHKKFLSIPNRITPLRILKPPQSVLKIVGRGLCSPESLLSLSEFGTLFKVIFLFI